MLRNSISHQCLRYCYSIAKLLLFMFHTPLQYMVEYIINEHRAHNIGKIVCIEVLSRSMCYPRDRNRIVFTLGMNCKCILIFRKGQMFALFPQARELRVEQNEDLRATFWFCEMCADSTNIEKMFTGDSEAKQILG